jgi:hypothetical protein
MMAEGERREALSLEVDKRHGAAALRSEGREAIAGQELKALLRDKFRTAVKNSVDKNTARLYLAACAVVRLWVEAGVKQDEQAGFTLRDLFSEFPDVRENRFIKEQGGIRRWQRDLAQRFVDHGLAEKQEGATLLYFPVETLENLKSDSQLLAIADEYFEGLGLKLKRIVFPGLYPSDGEGDGEASSEAGEDLADDEPTEDGGSVLSEVAAQLQTVAGSMQRVFEGLSALAERQETAHRQFIENTEKNRVVMERMLGSLEKIAAAASDEKLQLLKRAVEKLTELESRRKSASNQLEADSRRTVDAIELAVKALKAEP